MFHSFILKYVDELLFFIKIHKINYSFVGRKYFVLFSNFRSPSRNPDDSCWPDMTISTATFGTL